MSAPAAAPSCLRAQGLRKRYRARTVVHDVSLQVRGAEVVGLLGPNGAGKTTSFYMIVGLVRADAGELWIDEQPIGHLPVHRRAQLGLGYLPQEASIFRKLTVEQNVRAVLELQRDAHGRPLPEDELRARLEALLAELHVDHLRDVPAPALSGG
ncbi:MAG: ATP-binding cassette domain-containing protein, partial [Tepidimonas sp.]|nr:ATP-binding cassette domain-containing protein [Tepidimonas sp.]